MVCLACESPDNSDGDDVAAEDLVDNLEEFLAFSFRDRDTLSSNPDMTSDPDDVSASLRFVESHLKA